MKPLFQPEPVNDPFGDPVVYVDFLFEKRAMLLDLGEINPLPARKILRLTQIFVSHTHMDHFAGLDRIVRICLGRQRHLELFGPSGFIEQVGHRLAGYTWNLVHNYPTDFTLVAYELTGEGTLYGARFRCQTGFRQETLAARTVRDGVLVDDDTVRVRAVALDHRIPCLAFALEEKSHINVWKDRLTGLGIPTGPWLTELKHALRRGDPQERPFVIRWRDGDGAHQRVLPLGELRRELLRITPGQKVAFVVDAIYHADNARRIVELARGADVLFIEAGFLEADAARAAATYHLTARQAGALARDADVRRVVPLHFSARYAEQAAQLQAELEAAYGGGR